MQRNESAAVRRVSVCEALEGRVVFSPVIPEFETLAPELVSSGNAAILNRSPGDTYYADDDPRLTDNTPNQRGAIFISTARQLATPHRGPRIGLFERSAGFVVQFSFVLLRPTDLPAEGFAFVIQPHGPRAIGAGGAGLGYAGMPDSLAVKFDLSADGRRVSRTGLYAGGEMNDGGLDTVMDFADGRWYQVEIAYNADTQSIHQRINVRGNSPGPYPVFEHTYTTADGPGDTAPALDLEQIVGSDAAHFGFTGTTGPVGNVEQHILQFNLIRGVPSPGPKVTGVFVRGSAWGQAFKDHLAATDLGTAADGYRVGDGGVNSDELPWTSLDTITIKFSRAVTIAPDDVRVVGTVTGIDYAVTGMTYDATRHAATIRLDRPIRNDRVMLILDGDAATGVKAASDGLPLDGEFDNAGSGTLPSGNGTPGGDFAFRFNVLPGDVNRDGAVNVSDFVLVRNRFGRTATSLGDPAAALPNGYIPFHDVNGDGGINARDIVLTRRCVGNTLPTPEPAPVSAPLGVSHPPLDDEPDEVPYLLG